MSHPAEKLKRYTYGEYCSWPDDERWELIDGVAYSLSAAPSNRHQEILGELFLILGNYLKGKPCKIRIAPFDVRLPKTGQDEAHTDTVVQPDLSIFCDTNKMDAKGAHAAPDVVIEVLSPYTSRKDQTVKLRLYEREGVREYWCVHPNDEVVWVWRRAVDGQYGRPEIYTSADSAWMEPIGLAIDFRAVWGAAGAAGE